MLCSIAWTIIFLSLWKDFQNRFASIIESLKKQRDFVDTEAASIDIVESKESRGRLQQDTERRQKESIAALEHSEKHERILRVQHSIEWISIDDIAQETECEGMSRQRHEGTCEWINGLSQMKSWLKDDTKHSLLWLSGKPGAGIICDYLFEVRMLTHVHRQERNVFSYNRSAGKDTRVKSMLLLL
jgi:hypothetical protein